MAINSRHYRADLLTQFPKKNGQSDDDYKNKVLNKLMYCIPKMDKNTTIQAIKCLIREIMGGNQLDHNHPDLELLSNNPAFKNHIQIITGNSSRFFAVDKTRGAIMFLFALCERLSRLLEPRITIENDRPTRRQKVQFVSQVLLSISPLNNDTGSNKNYTLDNAELGVMFNLGNNRRPISLSLGNDRYLDECHIIKANPTGDVSNVQIGTTANSYYFFGANDLNNQPEHMLPINQLEEDPLDLLSEKLDKTNSLPVTPLESSRKLSPRESLLEILNKAGYTDKLKEKVLQCFDSNPPRTELDLSKCGLTEIPTKILLMLPHLQRIDLSRNQINQIEANAFAGVHNLQHLDLSENKISKIEVNAFVGLHSLQKLYLSGNKISKIEANTFAGLPSLWELRLTVNQISGIEANTFTELPSLKELYLGNNKISKIEVNAFAGLSKLQMLHLGRNQISEISGNIVAPSLKRLYLDDNDISKIEANALVELTSLQHLELNGNPISEIATDAFAGLISLRNIGLDRNVGFRKFFGKIEMNILDPLLYEIHKNQQSKNHITVTQSTYGCKIEINERAIIDTYIHHPSNLFLQNYCLQLLLHDNLQEPEAIEFLATGIYSGAIPLEKIYPQKTLDWVCNLFNKHNLSMLDFLVRNKDVKFEPGELQSVIKSSQLIVPPSSKNIEESIKQELIEQFKSMVQNIDPEVLLAVVNAFADGGGIVQLVDNQIKEQIKAIYLTESLDLSDDNINAILARVKSKAPNRLDLIRYAVADAIPENLANFHEIKKSLAEQLGKINRDTILEKTVFEYCGMLGIDYEQNHKKLEEFYDWGKVIRNHTSATFNDLARKTMTAIEIFRDHPPIYSDLILSCLPYLPYGYIRSIVNDTSPRVTQESKEQLDVIMDYCEICGIDDDSPAKVLCVSVSPPKLVNIYNLSHLNPISTELRLENMTLITLTGKDLNSSTQINANNLKEIEGKLPMWFVQCVKKQFTLANTMAKVLVEFINNVLNTEKIELAPPELDKLTACLYANAQNLGVNLYIPLQTKKDLMISLGDQRIDSSYGVVESEKGKIKQDGEFFLHKYTKIFERCKDNYEKNNTAFTITNISNKELEMLPEMLIRELADDSGYNIITNKLVKQLIPEFSTYESLVDIKEYEIFYLLGIYFANLSSTNGLGYHSGSDNRSFTRFRLYAAMCVSQCIISAKNDLSKDQKMKMCQEIKNLLLTAECAGQIANKLFGDYALFGALTERIRKILATTM